MNRPKGSMLTRAQSEALMEIKRRLFERIEVTAFLRYGSAARGEADEESDLDLLVVTSVPLTRFERHEITNIVFDVNLHNTTLSSALWLLTRSPEKQV